MLEMLRAGRVHLSGLRLLCGQLDAADGDEVLAAAAGKSKREIEVLLARRSPKPAVPDSVRRLPARRKVELANEPAVAAGTDAATVAATPMFTGATGEAAATPRARAAAVSPLSGQEYRVQFTALDEHMKRVDQAKGLLRHRLPSGDLATLYDLAMQALIEKTLKDRFGVGRTPRTRQSTQPGPATSRRVPAAVAREVYERDGGRCTFVDPEGRRCDSTSCVQIDHVDGFGRTREHRVDRLRLLCAAHNAHAADVMYGKRWMDRKRAEERERRGVATESPFPGKVDSACEEDDVDADLGARFIAAIELVSR
jgi:hypothetical protein